MKKVIYWFLLLVVVVFCLCGCQEEIAENPNDSSSSDENVSAESGADKDGGENNSEPNYIRESLVEKFIREIDGAYLKEQEDPQNNTTIGMVNLANKYTEKWKQVEEEYYNKIMEYDGIIQWSDIYYSSDDLHTFVSNMKNNWEQYNQEQCENYFKILQTIYGAGTIVGPIFANYEYGRQKEWTLQIVGICQQLHME